MKTVDVKQRLLKGIDAPKVIMCPEAGGYMFVVGAVHVCVPVSAYVYV
jgi:hypothetical protein